MFDRLTRFFIGIRAIELTARVIANARRATTQAKGMGRSRNNATPYAANARRSNATAYA
jgi:hypothetical protein